MKIKFDELNVEPCAIQSADDPVDCTKQPIEVDPPPVCTDLDICCADPAFASTHPDECSNRTRLLLKPEFVSKPVLQSVQYKTFLVNSSGQEIELTSGLTYTVSDITIGIIGAASGNLTTLAEGVTTVTVSWQNLTAHAQLNVVADCQDANVGMVLVIDNSRSMSQQFTTNFSTRLGYAKTVARRLASELNTTKDKIGLVSFNAEAQLVQPLTNDIGTIKQYISAVPSSGGKTDLSAGLKAAIDHLQSQTLDRRVVILFSDGEMNDGDDPLALADNFKGADGIIVVLGCRAHTQHFARLQKIATAGFFLNSYDVTNDKANSDLLSGMKGYFCAGNCVPEGDEYIATGALNYYSFKEWIVSGVVDLIGNGFYDFLPGNGMYVDLAGSGPPWKGRLASRRTFKLENGVTYALSLQMAGNQRTPLTGFVVKAGVGVDGSNLLSQPTVNVDDWQQDFTLYRWDFVGDGSEGNIVSIELMEQPVGQEPFGILLNEVRLDRITGPSALMLYDNFDDENLQYVGPGCGDPPPDPIPGQHIINVNAIGPAWVPKSAFRTGSWYSACMQDDGSTIYVGEFSGKIVRSQDGGATFAETSAPNFFWMDICCAWFADVVLAVGTDGTFSGATNIPVYVSPDGGGTWTPRTVQTGRYWTGCGIDLVGTNMVVVSGPDSSNEGYLFLSTNSGVNWTRKDAAGTKGFYGLDMDAAGTVILAAYNEVGTLKISTDGGTVWTTKVITEALNAFSDVALASSFPNIMMAVNDGEVWRSIDTGATWVKLDVVAAHWKRVSVSSSGLQIILGAEGQPGEKNKACMALSVDSGTTWRYYFWNESFRAVCLSQDGLKAVACPIGGPLRVAGSLPLDGAGEKLGIAAAGWGVNDFWNEWVGETPLEPTVIPDRLAYVDGSYPAKDIVLSEMVGGYDWNSEVVGNQPDPLMKRYLKSNTFNAPTDWKTCANLATFGDPNAGCRYVKLTGLPEGNWDFYVYGHGDANNENSRFRLSVDFDFSKELQTAEGPAYNGTWLISQHYVLFEKVHVKKDSVVYLFFMPPSGNSGGIHYCSFAGLQIKWVPAPSVPVQAGEGCYGTGCLDSPPPEQKPDPSPLPNIEL